MPLSVAVNYGPNITGGVQFQFLTPKNVDPVSQPIILSLTVQHSTTPSQASHSHGNPPGHRLRTTYTFSVTASTITGPGEIWTSTAGNHTYHVSSSSLVYSSLGMGSPLAVKELPQCYHTSIALTCASVLTYGCWGTEARETLSHLATRLATPMRCTKSQAIAAIYGRLSLTLVRSCARALLSRAGPSLVITG
ncbi:hypothetical protein EMCRGX_G022042 [Ephydatia muelleri]